MGVSALAAVGWGILLLGGCATTRPQKLQICPGKATAAEALQTLRARAEHAVALGAHGHAVLTYHASNRKKPERHALDLLLRFEPPRDIYLQGGTAVAPKAAIMGSNQAKFWLALSPKEISSYYVGDWQEVRDIEGLVLSPRVMLESIGLMTVSETAPNPARWRLDNKGPYDILTQRDESDRPVKRLQIYACDYTVRKIEYFDPHGKVATVAQLDEYQPVGKDFAVPTRIDVVSTRPDGRKDSIAMTMSSVRTMSFNEKQREVLFNPPPNPDRFEHVYHYQNGRWVEE